MNIIDIIIILFILMMGLLGLKRGFFKEVVMIAGTILVITISFLLKNPIADFFCLNLPFFDFKGVLQGATSLSIVFYQLLAFLLIAILLFAVLRIVVQVTGIFEKILSITIILGIPSKILGFIVGLLEGAIITFFALVILSIPLHSMDMFMNSTIRKQIVNDMPVLNDCVGGINDAIEEVHKLTEDKQNEKQFNYDVLEILLKYKIVSPDLANKLVEKGRLNNIDNVKELIKEYE